MKGTSLLLLLALVSGLLPAQYHVVHVKGRILGDGTNKPVEAGMIVKENAGLTFLTDGAELGLWHPQKGRMVAKVKVGSEGKRFLEPLVVPGSKADAFPQVDALDSKDAVLGYFKRGTFLVLPGTRVPISPKLYPMQDGGRFFVRYHSDSLGAECNARLSNAGDTLLLDAETMLQMNGIRMNPKDVSSFALVYFDAKRNFKHVCAVEFVLPDMKRMEQEVRSLMNLMKQIQPDFPFDARAEVLGFLKDFYGQPDQSAFNRWFESMR